MAREIEYAPMKTGFKVEDVRLRMDQTFLRKPTVKAADQVIDMSPEQELEFMKCSMDALYFAKNYYKITSLDRGFILFDMFKYQEELFEAFQENRFNISLQARQSGKCVKYDTKITIKNKETGEIINTNISEFHFVINDGKRIFLTDSDNQGASLSGSTNRKFLRSNEVNDWQIKTDKGFVDIKSTHITKKYAMWYLELESGKELQCADDHIVFKAGKDHIEKYVKNLEKGMRIHTADGIETVKRVVNMGYEEEMFDLQVDSDDARYYTNDILSHNTTVVACFLLWYAMFHSDKEIAVLANKEKQSKEILERVQKAYLDMPFFLQQGARKFGSTEIAFENGSKIFAYATSPDAIRGRSIALLYLDEVAFIENDMEFWESSFPAIAQSKSSKVIMTSTPKGERGLFHFIWVHAEEDENGVSNGFKRTLVTWKDVPLYVDDPEWEPATRARLGDTRFKQEFECLWGKSKITLQTPNGRHDFRINMEEAHKLMVDDRHVVYMHTSKTTGKSYVGISKRGFDRRWEEHCRLPCKGSAFNNAIEKHGSDDFYHEVLFVSEDGNYDKLSEMERHFIKEYSTLAPNGYNMTDGGGGTNGFRFSDTQKERMSESAKKRGVCTAGYNHTEEQKRAWSESRKGVKRSYNLSLSDEDVKQILNDYYFVTPWVDGVGERMKSGQIRTYFSAFAHKYAEIFNVHTNSIKQILKGRQRAIVYREFEGLQGIDPYGISPVRGSSEGIPRV